MKEIAERMAVARSVAEVGEVVADACARHVPFGTFGYAVMGEAVTDRPCMVVRSNEFPVDWLERRFPEMLLAIEQDLGGLQLALSERHAYDGYRKFPLETVRDKSIYQDHWRVYCAGQQLVAPLWRGSAPVGYFTICRGSKEARLTPADLQLFDDLRDLADRALADLAALPGAGDLGRTLDALSAVFPYPAYLFDVAGRLRWMSDEGGVRLGVAAARLGGTRLIRGNPALEEVSRQARDCAARPGVAREDALRAAGLLGHGERLAVRRFGEDGAGLLLLAFTPALAGLRGEAGGEGAPSLPRLGAVESRVARLAAEGYTVLNIATQLGVSEATVRTHLHRVYVKLGVHGRAELAFALLGGRS